MAALALGFTACDDVQDVVSVPQTNPQETIMSADGVTVAPGETLAGGSVNLQNLKDNEAKAAVLDLVTLENFPSKATAKVVMEISATDDFAAVQTVETVVTDSVAYVAPADWQAAHLALYGKNPMERTSYVRYAIYAQEGTSLVRIGYDEETMTPLYYGASSVLVTPFNPEVWIEEAYYVVVNGDKAAATALVCVGEDRFDTPKFKGTFTAAAGDNWQVYPQSAMDASAAVYGPEAEDAKTGALVEGTSGVIAEAGDYVVSVNMEEMTYSVAAAIQTLYVGRNGGSVVPARKPLMVSTEDYVTYQGYIYPKDGAFRFFTAQSSKSNSYGMVADAVATVENKYHFSVDLEYPSSTPITLGLEEAGMKAAMPMWATLDANALTLKAYAIETIGIIGDATADGWNSDVDMTTEDYVVWTATDVVLTDATIKFRANDGWDVNWGGSADNLQPNADNIPVTAGTYDITLDFSKAPYTCTLTAK